MPSKHSIVEIEIKNKASRASVPVQGDLTTVQFTICCGFCQNYNKYDIFYTGNDIYNFENILTSYPGCGCQLSGKHQETLKFIQNIELFRTTFADSLTSNFINFIITAPENQEILAEILIKLSNNDMVSFENLSEATEYTFNVVDNNSLCITTYNDIVENEKNLIELANSESGTCNIVIDNKESQMLTYLHWDINFGLYCIDLSLDELSDFYEILQDLPEIHIEWNAVSRAPCR
jgi:hypothetical protein